MSKILEKLISVKLNKEIEVKGGLAGTQLGFRKGYSTVSVMKEVKRLVMEANKLWDI